MGFARGRRGRILSPGQSPARHRRTFAPSSPSTPSIPTTPAPSPFLLQTNPAQAAITFPFPLPPITPSHPPTRTPTHLLLSNLTAADASYAQANLIDHATSLSPPPQLRHKSDPGLKITAKALLLACLAYFFIISNPSLSDLPRRSEIQAILAIQAIPAIQAIQAIQADITARFSRAYHAFHATASPPQSRRHQYKSCLADVCVSRSSDGEKPTESDSWKIWFFEAFQTANPVLLIDKPREEAAVAVEDETLTC